MVRSIVVDHLSKTFPPDARVLTEVTFREEGAGAVGYLGPNGAGKTTTLKLLVGLLRPTSGTVRLNGFDPVADRRRALWDVGAIVESPEPYPSETVFDALERVGALRGLDDGTIDEEIDRCHAALHLPPLEARCGWLSKGERQRVVLAAACLGDPEVLLLDEPTNGMDPGERIEVRRFLNRLKRDHLILVSTHLLHDVAEICDRVIFLDHGQIRRQSSVDYLTAGVRSRALLVEFAAPLAASAPDGWAAWVSRSTPVGERSYRLAFDGSAESRERILEACRAAGAVVAFGAADSPLEQAYREIVDASPAGASADPAPEKARP